MSYAERVVYVAECKCGFHLAGMGMNETEAGGGVACCGGADCPVVTTRVTYQARVPEPAPVDEARGESEEAS